MGTYQVPRNTKGESRILVIFSTKALIYSMVGVGIGAVFYYMLKMFGLGTVGIIIMAVLALIGFSIATFKIPELGAFPVTKEIAGEKIDEVIIRYIKYKHNSKKIYILKKQKAKEKNKGGE